MIINLAKHECMHAVGGSRFASLRPAHYIHGLTPASRDHGARMLAYLTPAVNRQPGFRRGAVEQSDVRLRRSSALFLLFCVVSPCLCHYVSASCLKHCFRLLLCVLSRLFFSCVLQFLVCVFCRRFLLQNICFESNLTSNLIQKFIH